MNGQWRPRSSHRLLAVALAAILGWGGAATAVAAASAQTVIQLATYGSTVDNWQAIADAFNAGHPGIKVEVQVYPFNAYIDKITTMVASGSPPDLFQTWAQYKPKWVEAGMLRDLTPLWEKSAILKNARIYPFMIDAARFKGRMYGVPYDYNAEVWFLNLDWLAHRGGQPAGGELDGRPTARHGKKVDRPGGQSVRIEQPGQLGMGRQPPVDGKLDRSRVA